MQQTTTIKTQQNFFVAAAPLFLVLFIDSMGLGLVFPILNALVFEPTAHFIHADLTKSVRDILFGVTISIFMFCWFFGAAFLGDLSDQIGRKKSLMICLLGAVVGYVLSAVAVIFSSYGLLLLGRIVAGFTAGSQSIAQAAIVDISEPAHKARNLGLILFFTSLGFALGPMIGGVLSDANLVHWFNYAMPFYFAATVSLINSILLWKLFHETFFHEHKIRFKLYHAIEIFVAAFKDEKIRELSIIMLVMIFGWSGFYSFISMYLFHTYHFTALQTGFYMGLMGAGFGIGTGFLVDWVTKRFSLKQCMMMGCLLAALGTVLTITAPAQIYVWFDVLIVSIAIALAYSAILTIFSNQVDADSQGWIMGITGSIMAFAFGLNGLLVGLLASVGPKMPMIVTAACLTLAAVLMKFLFRENGRAPTGKQLHSVL
ncbi:MAG TPA: MFS transporter [Gammaproteobacteria bacterium]|nr:MFS transporter [Gammaproteobacteria bacterium]